MTQFIVDNKEILSLCVSALGILLTFMWSGVLSWRHKICLDYESRRDVAINVLRDRYVERASNHYSDVAEEREQKKTSVEEIYKRPQQQQLIRELGRDLEDQNRVRRLFRRLALASQASSGFVWAGIVVVVLGIALLLFSLPAWFWVIWAVVLVAMAVGFVVCFTLMLSLDGRFFQLVHRIIEPEGE